MRHVTPQYDRGVTTPEERQQHRQELRRSWFRGYRAGDVELLIGSTLQRVASATATELDASTRQREMEAAPAPEPREPEPAAPDLEDQLVRWTQEQQDDDADF